VRSGGGEAGSAAPSPPDTTRATPSGSPSAAAFPARGPSHLVGLIPSVENIAMVCFELLRPEIDAQGRGARLRSVTVWETEKTSCTYPA